MWFDIYDGTENRVVKSNGMNLCILCKKVTSIFLQHIKASIAIEFTKIPINITYEHASANFRNEVNRKLSPEMGKASHTQRSIHETPRKSYIGNSILKSSKYVTKGHCNSRGGYKHSIASSYINSSKRSDTRSVLCTDGVKHNVNPSYNFSSYVLIKTIQAKKRNSNRREEKVQQGKKNCWNWNCQFSGDCN